MTQLSLLDYVARRPRHRDRPLPVADYHRPEAGEAIVEWTPSGGYAEGIWRWPGATDADWRTYVTMRASQARASQVVRVYRDGVCVWDSRDGGAL